MMTKLMKNYNDIVMNTDPGFAIRIISKYSITGEYYFEGITLTYLDMNTLEQENTEAQNDIYLSLKLLIALNYRQLFSTMVNHQKEYLADLQKVLQNYMKQLRLHNTYGYEYINRVYQLVASPMDHDNREGIQYFLEEQMKRFPARQVELLTKEQKDIIQRVHINKSIPHEYTAPSAVPTEKINNQLFDDNLLVILLKRNQSRISLEDDVLKNTFRKSEQDKPIQKELMKLKGTEKQRKHLTEFIKSAANNRLPREELISYVTKAKSIELHNVMKQISNLGTSVTMVTSKEELVTFLQQSSDQELLQLLQSLETDHEKIYVELLQQQIMKAELSKAELQYYNIRLEQEKITKKQKDQLQQMLVEKLYSQAGTIQQGEKASESGNIILNDLVIQATKARIGGIGSLVKWKDLHWKDRLNSNSKVNWYRRGRKLEDQPHVLKEKLIEMVSLGSIVENHSLLQQLLTVSNQGIFVDGKSDIRVIRDETQGYANTQELIYLIRNSGEEQLETIVNIVNASKEYREKWNEIFNTQSSAKQGAPKDTLKQSSSRPKDIQELLSTATVANQPMPTSIKANQLLLSEQQVIDQTKEKLITLTSGASSFECSRVLDMIKNSFTQEELTHLSEQNYSRTSDRQEYQTKELTHIISRLDRTKLLLLLKQMKAEEVFQGAGHQELMNIELQKYEVKESNQPESKLKEYSLLESKVKDYSLLENKVKEYSLQENEVKEHNLQENRNIRITGRQDFLNLIQMLRQGKEAQNFIPVLKKELVDIITGSQFTADDTIYHSLLRIRDNDLNSKQEEPNPPVQKLLSIQVNKDELITLIDQSDTQKLERVLEVFLTSKEYEKRIKESLKVLTNKSMEQYETSVITDKAMNKRINQSQSDMSSDAITEVSSRQRVLEKLLMSLTGAELSGKALSLDKSKLLDISGGTFYGEFSGRKVPGQNILSINQTSINNLGRSIINKYIASRREFNQRHFKVNNVSWDDDRHSNSPVNSLSRKHYSQNNYNENNIIKNDYEQRNYNVLDIIRNDDRQYDDRQNDYRQNDYRQNDYRQNDYRQNDERQNDYRQNDDRQNDYKQNDDRQNDYRQNDDRQNDYKQNDYSENNIIKNDYEQRNYNVLNIIRNDYKQNDYSENNIIKNDYEQKNYNVLNIIRNDYRQNDYNINNRVKNDYRQNDYNINNRVKNDYSQSDYNLNNIIRNDYSYSASDISRNISSSNDLSRNVIERNTLRSNRLSQNNPNQKHPSQTDQDKSDFTTQKISAKANQSIHNQANPHMLNVLQPIIRNGQLQSSLAHSLKVPILFRQEKPKENREETVKKAVREYIISERAELNYSTKKSIEATNELNLQKSEILKLQDTVKLQSRQVEELQKQLSTESNLPKIDTNQLSKDVLKKLEQQMMIARQRRGLD